MLDLDLTLEYFLELLQEDKPIANRKLKINRIERCLLNFIALVLICTSKNLADLFKGFQI